MGSGKRKKEELRIIIENGKKKDGRRTESGRGLTWRSSCFSQFYAT